MHRSLHAALLLLLIEGCFALSHKEIKALIELKQIWNVSDWQGEPNCTTWSKHISCNRQSNVISLEIGFAKPVLLSGPVPEAICNLTYLQELRLYGNRLAGTLPSCIGTLSDLKYLDFSGNCLGGEIPESFGNLRKMEYFDLSVNHHNEFSFLHRDLCKRAKPSNGLTGYIPESLGMMRKVKYFYLSGNNLTGPIPRSIGNLTSVMYLYINANNLTGSLPSGIGNLQNLQDLQLNKNQITGPIPEEIGNCSSLRIIQMNRNRITGSIPPTIGNLAQLQALELLKNNLQGSIPEFKTTPVLDLNLFDLRFNNLSGKLPDSFRDAPLRYLFVNGNKRMQGFNSSLPDFILPDFGSSSVIDEKKHFDCPGYRILSRTFQVTGPLIQMDPEYYKYRLCKCREKFYGNPPDNCRPCLKYGQCQNSEMSFQKGYFPVVDKNASSAQSLLPCSWTSIKYSPCNPKGNCFFGRKGLASTTGKCTLCAKGYEGRLCSKCTCKARDSCYFNSHAQCIPCKVFSKVELALTVIAFLAVLVLFAIFQQNSMVRLLLTAALVALALSLNSNSWLYFNVLLLFILLSPMTGSGTSSGLVKVAIIYFQTVSSVVPPYLIRRLSNLFTTVNVSNLKFVGFVCVFPELLGIPKYSLANKFIVSTFAPAAVLVIILIFLCVKKLARACFRIEVHEQSFAKQVALVMIFVSYFSFFNAASLFISVFSCKKDPLGRRYMNAQTYQSVLCYGDEWHIMFKTACVGFCLFILLPILVFCILLYRFKGSLYEETTASWLGYLYTSYKPKEDELHFTSWFGRQFWSFFEVLFMSYRFILAVSISVPDSDSIWRPIGMGIVLFSILPVFLFIKPYTRPTDNIIAFVTILSLIFTLFASTTITQSAEDLTPAWILIALVNACTILMFVVLTIARAWDDLRNSWKKLKLGLVALYTRLKNIRLFRKENDLSESMIQS